jgi:ABC-type Fe3+/spermidine/putrescine transport system ATPase subunit
MSDRIALMHRGRLEQVGTPEDIYLRPRTRFAAEFLGAMNWIEDAGIRPENTRLARAAPNHGARSRTALIETSTFLGNCFHIHARLDSGEVVVAEVPRADNSYRAGDAVHVWWNAADELPLPSGTQ